MPVITPTFSQLVTCPSTRPAYLRLTSSSPPTTRIRIDLPSLLPHVTSNRGGRPRRLTW